MVKIKPTWYNRFTDEWVDYQNYFGDEDYPPQHEDDPDNYTCGPNKNEFLIGIGIILEDAHERFFTGRRHVKSFY